MHRPPQHTHTTPLEDRVSVTAFPAKVLDTHQGRARECLWNLGMDRPWEGREQKLGSQGLLRLGDGLIQIT